MDHLMKSIVIGLLSACFILSTFNIIGVEGGRRLSEDEDIELEKQLKLLNKPSIKTIQMKHGEIYDCVDFYKQPAFDHPLLKNHTFHYQTRPSSVPQVGRKGELFSAVGGKEMQEVKVASVDCPMGTVPIRRVTKEDLVRFELNAKQIKSNYSVLTLDNPGTHYSVYRTRVDPESMYDHGSTLISVYAPTVLSSQYSSARMKFQNGNDHIEFGWTVNPTLYGDIFPHFYTFLKAGDSKCFNLQCPGFVQIDNTTPVDAILLDVSVGGGPISAFQFVIYKNEDEKRWDLYYGKEYVTIGYWPEEIFSSLKNKANAVEWGGEVFSPVDVPSPPLGSGRIPRSDPFFDAFCAEIVLFNDGSQIYTRIIEPFSDAESGYGVTYKGDYNDYLRDVMFFGGPGGATGP